MIFSRRTENRPGELQSRSGSTEATPSGQEELIGMLRDQVDFLQNLLAEQTRLLDQQQQLNQETLRRLEMAQEASQQPQRLIGTDTTATGAELPDLTESEPTTRTTEKAAQDIQSASSQQKEIDQWWAKMTSTSPEPTIIRGESPEPSEVDPVFVGLREVIRRQSENTGSMDTSDQRDNDPKPGRPWWKFWP